MVESLVALFLVFSGFIIAWVGFFKWYGDPSEDKDARRSLARENEDLRTSLKLAHGSHEKLDERFTRQKGQLTVLQQLCDDWSNNREQGERERATLEVEASDKTRRYEEAMEELQKEKKLRIALEDDNHRLTQEQLTSVASLEDTWRQKHSKIESSLFQRQAELKSTSGEKVRLAKQLHSAESRIAELQSDLLGQKNMLESATSNVSGLRQEYVSLESSLTENSDLLKQAKADCAAALSAKRVAEEALAGLQANYDTCQQQIETLQSKVANMESLEAQVVSLQESISNSTVQIEKVSTQRDKALEAEKASLNRASGMQQRIENQETTIHNLREKRDEALHSLKVELEKRNQVETQLEKKLAAMELRLNEETVQMQNQASTFELQAKDVTVRLESERADWKSRLSAQEHDIEQMKVNRDEAVAQRDQVSNELEKLMGVVESERADWISRFSAQEKGVEQMRVNRDETVVQRDQVSSELEKFVYAVESERNDWTDRFSAQGKDIEEIKSHRDQAVAQRDQVSSELNKLIDVVESERSDWTDRFSAQKQDVEQVRLNRDEVIAQRDQVSAELQKMMKAVEEERNDWTQRLDTRVNECHQLSQSRSELKTELGMIQKALLDRDAEFTQQTNLQNKWQEQLSLKTKQIEALGSSRDGLKAELAKSQQELSGYEAQLEKSKAEQDELRAQVEELKATCQQIHELEGLVKARDAQESQVEGELKELREQYAASYEKQQRFQAELERVQAEKHQLASEFGTFGDQIDSLQAKVKASEETIRMLRRERAGVLARLANYRTIAEPDATVISFTEAMAQRRQSETVYDKEYGGHLRQHETRGLVYTEAPETRDDLKRISGIAEILEGRLNDYGIYTFKQVMEWKPEAIEEFSRLLAFRDRIERDDWLSQARFFYDEKQKLTRRSVAA